VTADPRGHGAAPATLGVDLGGTGTRVAALSADGQVLREASFPTVAHGTAAAVTGLADALTEIADGRKVSAVGIGASGPVTPDGTIDNAATLPAYAGVDLCRALEQATGWPCVIDNDAAAAALGEYTYGAGRGSRTCLVVTLGTGVGVGIITGGRPLRAGDGTHAEAGHIAVPDAPRPCYCGLPCCWEQAASRIALEELTGVGPAAAPGLSVAAVAAAARGGDSQGACAFECYGRQVAPGLSTLLTIFRPDRVVLGGSAAQYLDLFSGSLVAALGRSAPYQWNPPIVAAELGDIAGAVGAAVLARL
jgi:glucokinase